MLGFYVILTLAGFALKLVVPEPHCSRFHYEEQTLEKMIRMEMKLEKAQEELDKLKEIIDHSTEAIAKLQQPHDRTTSTVTTYVRWGRTLCPNTLGTNEVYSGYMAGNHYNTYGGGANDLCLPNEPTFKQYVRNNQNSALLYGTELETEALFNGRDMNNQDIPCVVCETTRQTTLMVPGRSSCYETWTTEYTGYLVASSDSFKGSSHYSCLDDGFEPISGNRGNDEHVLQPVEIQCGTLPCPPYVNGAEVACVVCSK